MSKIAFLGRLYSIQGYMRGYIFYIYTSVLLLTRSTVLEIFLLAQNSNYLQYLKQQA